METARKRILYFIEKQGIKASDFLNLTGLKKGFIDKSHENSGASDINLSKILEVYPALSAEWLLTGEGEMMKDQAKEKFPQPTNSDPGIPLIPIDAMAGWGSGSFQIMDYETERYVVPEFEELKVDFMIRVKGSSMYPKYSSGDLVACKKLPLDTFFQWNKVYVLDTVQGAIIKRVKKSKKENHISCISDNEDYEPFDLDIGEINSLSIVVGVIRLE